MHKFHKNQLSKVFDEIFTKASSTHKHKTRQSITMIKDNAQRSLC